MSCAKCGSTGAWHDGSKHMPDQEMSSADKPEAGRTCKWKWCGAYVASARRVRYCSKACREAKTVVPAARPVERCSCDEATRYKVALEHLIADVQAVRDDSAAQEHPMWIADDGLLDYIERIARRALSLGGDENEG